MRLLGTGQLVTLSAGGQTDLSTNLLTQAHIDEDRSAMLDGRT